MSDGTSDGLLFPELRRNSRDGQMTENICCASACDDTGTSAVLCLQLILAQRGDTGVLFYRLTQESFTHSLSVKTMWMKRNDLALCHARCA